MPALFQYSYHIVLPMLNENFPKCTSNSSVQWNERQRSFYQHPQYVRQYSLRFSLGTVVFALPLKENISQFALQRNFQSFLHGLSLFLTFPILHLHFSRSSSQIKKGIRALVTCVSLLWGPLGFSTMIFIRPSLCSVWSQKTNFERVSVSQRSAHWRLGSSVACTTLKRVTFIMKPVSG